MYRVLVPTAPTDTIPAGAALLEAGHGRGLVFYSRQDSFGERCAQAARGGRMVVVPEGAVIVGYFNEFDGELQPDQRQLRRLEAWLGQRVYRNDLQARDNRSDRRAQARRLTMQGRTAEAFRLDRRLGL